MAEGEKVDQELKPGERVFRLWYEDDRNGFGIIEAGIYRTLGQAGIIKAIFNQLLLVHWGDKTNNWVRRTDVMTEAELDDPGGWKRTDTSWDTSTR